MSSSKSVFFLILTSISFIDFLPCVHCQLPNIYDLTWFDSFSLENYEGLFNSQDTKLHDASNLDEKIVNSNNGYEKSKKTTEENNESADASLEEGGHFDSRFVQQSDRYETIMHFSLVIKLSNNHNSNKCFIIGIHSFFSTLKTQFG